MAPSSSSSPSGPSRSSSSSSSHSSPAPENDRSKSTISSSRHPARFDSDKINRAIERVAGGDDAFVDRAIESLQGLQFPAFKFKILEHVRGNSGDPDVVALFEGLDGYIEYKDAYQVRKLVEENGAKYKLQNQITDEARINPNFKTLPAPAGGRSTKELEAAGREEERADYPEVTPTAMSNFVCNRCGKPFQNQNDLEQHQKFESGEARDIRIPGSEPPHKV